ncbi:MAG: response regulator transcription factor [Kiritimatiellia bacterium]
MKILLVDDHAATREEMVSIISEQAGMNVVGQASGGEEGVRRAEELNPDLIVMDVIMPGMNGIQATKAISAAHPAIRILALSNHTGRSLVQTVLDAGAAGYVRKDLAYEELIPAITAVSRGEQYIGNGLTE